jgi:hypothetical protein
MKHMARLITAYASFYLLGPWAWIAMMVGHYKVLTSEQGWAVALSPVTLGLMAFCLLVDLGLLALLKPRRGNEFPAFHHYPLIHWAWLGAFGTFCTWIALTSVFNSLGSDPETSRQMVAHGQWLGMGLTFAFFVPLNLHLAEAWETPQLDYRRYTWVAAFFSSGIGVFFLLKGATVAGQIHPDLAQAHLRSTWISIFVGMALNVWTVRGFLERQKLLREDADDETVTA